MVKHIHVGTQASLPAILPYEKRLPKMDEKTLEFVTYCIAKLAALLKMPQRQILG